jgi:hypothetical protein
VMCEDILTYIGSKGSKNLKNKPNLPTSKSTKDMTIVEEENKPKSLKDHMIASLILVLTTNDIP